MNDELARAEISRLVDELFITCDEKDWATGEALFVKGPVETDMSSLVGGGPVTLTAAELYQGFRQGLHAGKQSHHMATNYRITFAGDSADVWCHGYAWNHLPALPDGESVWETWGNYRLGAVWTPDGWRLNAFRYYSKRTAGNDAVRAHAT